MTEPKSGNQPRSQCFLGDADVVQWQNSSFPSCGLIYADLFAQPGWQASEFRRALWRAWFSVDDWLQAEQHSDAHRSSRKRRESLRELARTNQEFGMLNLV